MFPPYAGMLRKCSPIFSKCCTPVSCAAAAANQSSASVRFQRSNRALGGLTTLGPQLEHRKHITVSATTCKAYEDESHKRIIQGNAPAMYLNYLKFRDEKLKEALESKTRFQKIGQRELCSSLSREASRLISMGKIVLEYRGILSWTGPLDKAIYSQLFSHVKPATVFEFGSLKGGTSLWIVDYLNISGIKSHVYSIDVDHSLLDPRVHKFKPENLTFIEGDNYKIEETLPSEFLQSKPHPWVLVEDAHANSIGVLEHFHKFMKEGDYIIYDDSDPETPIENGMGWKGYPREYTPCGFGKLEEITGFLKKYDSYYSVDTFFTDMFGYNATNNWSGYIRRMA